MKRRSKSSIPARSPRPTVREHAALLEEVQRLRRQNEQLRDEKYLAHLALFGSRFHTNDWPR